MNDHLSRATLVWRGEQPPQPNTETTLMKMRLMAKHTAKITKTNGDLRLQIDRPRVLLDTNDGPTVIYEVGEGCRHYGLTPLTWAFLNNGAWFIRLPGNGKRGQYRQTKNGWSTAVRKADKDERTGLNLWLPFAVDHPTYAHYNCK